jgi:tetratricopeptide (TPR) repeat protein
VFSVALQTPVPALHLWLAIGLVAAGDRKRARREVAIPARAVWPIAGSAACVLILLVYAMSSRPFAARIAVRDGYVAKSRGGYDEAVEAFDRAIERDGWNLAARYEKAICLVELDRYDEALAAYREVETFAPEYVHVHYNMGMIHVFRHRWQEAADRFGRAGATGAVPSGFDVAKAVAIATGDARDEAKEYEIFKMVVASRFDDEAMLRGVGGPALERQFLVKANDYYLAGKLGRARAMYELLLSRDGDNRVALNNLAGIFFQQRDWDGAIGICRKILAKTPDDHHVALNLARAYVMKRDRASARAVLRRVLERSPGHEEAAKLLRALQRGE